MSKTRIFVSSTCYDLAAVREDLRRFILQLGHEPLLSEYHSFPINPDQTTIQNCKKSVESHTDVLVLIVGGKRGALDPASGKSVTNLEYDTARQKGIPCFVFVSRPVLTLLPIWKKNPSADFTSAVDYPEVFKFIERIREENRWTFPFDKTQEIEECLSIQLSTMLRDLLTRHKAGILDPIANYANESSEAQRIAREKPKYWEYLLTAELFKTKLTEVRRQFERQKTGSAYIASRPVTGREFFSWVQSKLNDLGVIGESFKKQMALVQESWGPPGTPGDVQKIKQSVDDFIQLCYDLIEWEKDIRSIRPPEQARALKETMKGWTEYYLKEVETLPTELTRPLETPGTTGVIEIMLKIKSPPIDEFTAEMEALTQTNPLEWY